MGRLTCEADHGLEDWQQILYNVPSDPEGAYSILDLSRAYADTGNADCAHILQDISLKLKVYEDTGLTPEMAVTVTIQLIKQNMEKNIGLIEMGLTSGIKVNCIREANVELESILLKLTADGVANPGFKKGERD